MHVYSEKLKLPELVQWLRPFALPQKLERNNFDNSELFFRHEISNHANLHWAKSYKDFQKRVLDDDAAAIVYFSTDTDQSHLQTLKRIADTHGDFINCVWF